MFHSLRAVPLAAMLAGLSTAAGAHVTLRTGEAVPGTTYRGILVVGHGCDGRDTSAVSVTVPPQIDELRPEPKPGWTLAVEPAANGARRVTWSGGTLPAASHGDFAFAGEVAASTRLGEVLAMPVVQTCGSTTILWGDVASSGAASSPVAEATASHTPAPTVRIVAADSVRATVAGDLTISTPWLRATPGGAVVAGGYLSVRNGGREPDRLLAASIPVAREGSVHEVTTRDGVSGMGPVADGLAIAPGETVTLKPGGYHLMFTGLSAGLAAGESVTGTLTFARAGTVTVSFAVLPAGAPGPVGAAASGGHAHTH